MEIKSKTVTASRQVAAYTLIEKLSQILIDMQPPIGINNDVQLS